MGRRNCYTPLSCNNLWDGNSEPKSGGDKDMTQQKEITTPAPKGLEEFLGGKVKKWRYYVSPDGVLGVIERSQVPVENLDPIERVYFWQGSAWEIRAGHAHADGTWEVFQGIHGVVLLTLDDGQETVQIELQGGDAIYMPHMVWHDVVAIQPGTLMNVLTNRAYDRQHYLEDKDAFYALVRK